MEGLRGKTGLKKMIYFLLFPLSQNPSPSLSFFLNLPFLTINNAMAKGAFFGTSWSFDAPFRRYIR